ncbi:Retrovirus-related Pol polyprotein from transposon TNT 1-94-like protein [Drosera capensis]
MEDIIVFLQEQETDVGLVEDDPINFRHVMESSKSQKWIDAMNDEIKSKSDNDVWELVSLPESVKLIGCKSIFKTKKDSEGNIIRFKARLVAKRYTKKEGIDFKETFSPISSKDSFRIIMAPVTHFDLEFHQMDVKTVFLNGDIEEIIYMQQPENFVLGDPKKMVCKLKKSIYGLKQPSRQWYHKCHNVITSFSFEPNIADDCIYHKFSASKYIFLVLYVGGILLVSNDKSLLHKTKRFFSKKFEMKDLGDASFVLGIQIHRDRLKGVLKLSQKGYIDKVFKRYDMQDCKPGDTPVTKGYKFSLNQYPKNGFETKEMEKTPYACTRPDLVSIVGILSRYLSTPGIDHWKITKMVMLYTYKEQKIACSHIRGRFNLRSLGITTSILLGVRIV